MEKLAVIVPAAGAGIRLGMGMNKAFVPLNGVPIIGHCLKMLNDTGLISRCVVALGPAELEQGEDLLLALKRELFPQLDFTVVAGGSERQDSVANALAVLGDDGYIAVHDGARPFAGKEVFLRTLAAARTYGAAVAAVPVKNTIKVVDANGLVIATPARNSLRAVQTPQIFAATLLKKAYAFLREHQQAVTDDASVVELYGEQVAVALGSYENIKITTPEDLALARQILKLGVKEK